jgi:uncharacterized membrane protein
MLAIISAAILFLLGLLAVSDFVTKQIPATEDLLNKITPVKGWLGLIFAVYGLVTVVNSLLYVGSTKFNPIVWSTSIIIGVLMFGVGLLVGFEKIAALTGQGDKLEVLRAKFEPHQRNMGFLCLIMATWAIVYKVLS